MRLHRDDLYNGEDLEKAQLVQNCDIYLDGQPVKYCIMADEEKGEIERYATRPNGELILTGVEFETEILHGKVEIRDLRNKE